mmetsp:Transcript_11161/g.12573  ORF Transcript_11161/g.12573 Transcript_11161/m.12573 type:complete len:228 (-) Transcript_11161:34-717(-)
MAWIAVIEGMCAALPIVDKIIELGEKFTTSQKTGSPADYDGDVKDYLSGISDQITVLDNRSKGQIKLENGKVGDAYYFLSRGGLDMSDIADLILAYLLKHKLFGDLYFWLHKFHKDEGEDNAKNEARRFVYTFCLAVKSYGDAYYWMQEFGHLKKDAAEEVAVEAVKNKDYGDGYYWYVESGYPDDVARQTVARKAYEKDDKDDYHWWNNQIVDPKLKLELALFLLK